MPTEMSTDVRLSYQDRIQELEMQVFDLHCKIKEGSNLKRKDVCVNCEGLLMTLKVSQQKYDQHIENLKQRISELEAQLEGQEDK